MERSVADRIHLSIPLLLILAALPVVLAAFISLLNHTLSASFCANSLSCLRDLSGRYEPDANGFFEGQEALVPSELAEGPTAERVLGEAAGAKHIAIDLSSQRLFAHEGDQVVFDFPISSGKWYPTPTGDFRIWVKLRYTRMEGGNPNNQTYYNLPNVPYTMYFYNDKISKNRGFGLHGAYWHNNFGHPMSHGCVNISPTDAERLYYWAEPPIKGNVTYAGKDSPGTLLTIYGVAPRE